MNPDKPTEEITETIDETSFKTMPCANAEESEDDAETKQEKNQLIRIESKDTIDNETTQNQITPSCDKIQPENQIHDGNTEQDEYRKSGSEVKGFFDERKSGDAIDNTNIANCTDNTSQESCKEIQFDKAQDTVDTSESIQDPTALRLKDEQDVRYSEPKPHIETTDGLEVTKEIQSVDLPIPKSLTPISIDTIREVSRNLTDDIDQENKTVKHTRIVMIGITGCGKSATGNSILGKKVFQTSVGGTSMTSKCEHGRRVFKDRTLEVVDTPGLFDTDRSEEDVERELARCICMLSPGPHAFLIIIKVGRFNEQEKKTVELLINFFGDDSFLNFSIVIITRKDELEDHEMTLEKFIRDSPSSLQQIINQCGGRCFAVNNKLKSGDESDKQTSELLSVIDDMVNKSVENCYTHTLFAKVEKERQDRLEEEKKRKDKEQKEREIKEREKEIRCKELELKLKQKQIDADRERERRIQLEKEMERKKRERKRKKRERENEKLKNQLREMEWQRQDREERERRDREERERRDREERERTDREERERRDREERERTDREERERRDREERERRDREEIERTDREEIERINKKRQDSYCILM